MDGNGSPISFNLRLPGQYEDLHGPGNYNYARYYSPELNRYLQADPLGFDGGVNYYLYAHANPVVLVDPFGEAATTSDYLNCLFNPFDCSHVRKCQSQAFSATSSRFGSGGGHHNGPADAFRHCYWNCCMAQKIGKGEAKKFGDGHEEWPGNPKCEKDMDLANNETGRNLGAANPTGDCSSLCGSAPLQNSPGPDCTPCPDYDYY